MKHEDELYSRIKGELYIKTDRSDPAKVMTILKQNPELIPLAKSLCPKLVLEVTA